MKTITFILLILLLLTNINCSKKQIIVETEIKNLIYDSQDNIIKFDDLQWETSWDFDNNTAGNNDISMIYLYDDNKLLLFDNIGLNIINIYSNHCEKLNFERNNNIYEIDFPNIAEYLENDDVFYFLLEIEKK